MIRIKNPSIISMLLSWVLLNASTVPAACSLQYQPTKAVSGLAYLNRLRDPGRAKWRRIRGLQQTSAVVLLDGVSVDQRVFISGKIAQQQPQTLKTKSDRCVAWEFLRQQLPSIRVGLKIWRPSFRACRNI